MSVLLPNLGRLTFEAEGNEKGPYHSRILHVPSPFSGLTLGRGYDMKNKTAFKINQDLIKAGLKPTDAKTLSRAAGLFGTSAKNFISNEKLGNFEITHQQQVKLFEITYKEEESETKRLCMKSDVTARYGKCNWQKIHPAIKQLLVDLKFRGDYTGG